MVSGMTDHTGKRFIGYTLLAVGAYCAYFIVQAHSIGTMRGWPLALLLVRGLIEVGFVVYATCFSIAALRFLWRRQGRYSSGKASYPPLAIIYLCCGDHDEEALKSLGRLRYPGQLLYLLHDDSREPAMREKVDRAVTRLRAAGTPWRVYRRDTHAGGKAGVLQYLLQETGTEYERFLVADNDSFAHDPDVLIEASPCFNDPGVAVVQFRNMARPVQNESRFSARVAVAVEVFDAFLTGLFHKLWMPFVGHNAILDTRAVLDAGGFTPGMFADDLDLTVRLNLLGYRVAYRRDLEMQEQHPSSYRSFCLRSRKWALGCAQVLRTHFWNVLTTRNFSAEQKVGFFLFTGVYFMQIGMITYLVLLFFIWPFAVSASPFPSFSALMVGTFLPLSIFLPVVAYLFTEGKHLPLFRTLAAFTSVYGSTDWWTLRGLVRGLRQKAPSWQPTNRITDKPQPIIEWSHFSAGVCLILAALLWQPALAIYPLTWLFCGKYLFVPAVAVHYTHSEPRETPATALMSQSIVIITLIIVAVSAFGRMDPRLNSNGSEPATPSIAAATSASPIKGIHYSPWRAGTGPGRGIPYPDDDDLAADLEMIRATGANTILVYQAPQRLLDLAAQFDLNVIYAFHVEWWKLAEGSGQEIVNMIGDGVAGLGEQGPIIGWMAGHEMPGWVIDKVGAEDVRAFLGRLRSAIRTGGSDAPVCYGNWPPARDLRLDRDLDFLCYNVYPFYPPEVAARGFGRFIAEELVPLAQGRPLLITEFGINTIEVSPERQAEVLDESWRALLSAGAQGGFVFEFADEWWKNYDNPVQAPDWWRRIPAPDDHLTADEDPEEAYGIVEVDRQPKPAYHAVRDMFSEDVEPMAPASRFGDNNSDVLKRVAWVLAVTIVGLALIARLWNRRS